MPARRSSSPSPAPPSSPPPFASQQFGAEQSPSEHHSHVSPTWTAPSPTRTLGYSSPELPPLPSLSTLGQHPSTPSNAPRNERTDTSYYTASWGSPYRRPPPPAFNPSRHLSANFGSDDFDQEASPLQFGLGHLLPSRLELAEESPNRFNLEHLIPRLEQNASPVQFTLEHLIRSRLPDLDTPRRDSRPPGSTPRQDSHPSGTTPRASDTNPTSEEWVRRFLETRWNREANDWHTSSDTEASAHEPEPALQPPPKRGHKDRTTNKTLNQQDFWRHFSKDEKTAIGKMMASKYADPDVTPSPRQASGTGSLSPHTANGRYAQVDASPTPLSQKTASNQTRPVADATAEKTPVRFGTQRPSKPVAETSGQSFLAPPGPVRAQTPRVRKKVVVKGKGCIISIPRDIPRGNPGYPPKPMTEEAVRAKFERLQSDGYDIRGFSTGSVEPHHRAIWPTEADVRAERDNSGSRYIVRVAKLSEWKDYENSLLEAKLAALGVSMGGEEDVPLPMSRQTSSQHPGLPFSPPIPTSSAGSHHRIGRQGSIVSGHFPLGPSPGHMSRQSIASPAAFGNPRASMHMHRHSTFASPANFAQHAISPSGTWSPGGYFGSQDGRSGSPALNRPPISGLCSPHSSYGMSPHQPFSITPTQKDDFLVQVQVQQQQLQTPMLQQQQQQLLGMRPSSTLAATTLAEVPEDEDEDDDLPAMKHANNNAPEIAVPTPRGHHHNISENLEREAANEEYHLEEAIDKQFAEGGDFSTEPESQAQFKLPSTTVNSTWEDSRTILHQPQPHSRAHSLAKSQQPQPFSFSAQQNARADSDGARTNLSENTNSSLEEGEIPNTTQGSVQHSKATSQVSNSWKDNKFAAFSKPGSAIHSKHNSKSSISKLNVEAKEFKFNPAASFNPGSFSSGFNFSPADKPAVDTMKPRNGLPSIDGLASFHVSAPTFKPDVSALTPTAAAFMPTAPAFNPMGQAPAFAPGLGAASPLFAPATAASFPTGGFNFASPSSFKPDAPAFNRNVSSFDPLKTDTAPTSFSSKIFGNVNISARDIIKPATRSKAVPIVRPDAASEKTTEEEGDKDDDASRAMKADGREKRVRRDRADGDDVPKFALQPVLASQPLGEGKQLQAAKQPRIEQERTSEDKEDMSPDTKHGRSNSVSKTLENVPPSRETHARKATAPTALNIGTPEIGNDDQSPSASDVPTPTTENPEPSFEKHGHKSNLSASAKPFEFKPQFSNSGYDFGFHVTKPSRAEAMDKSLISPPRSSRSPATTFRPSDDGSFKTALESGRHARYPESESVDMDGLGDASFNDIDAVMKHMNDEGSDFGVERDDNSWDQSSPHRTPHEFDRRDLQPSLKMRSDAPSSPRRFNLPRHMQGSATSNQDPFDDERAAIGYNSPVHRLNNADDVPVSDWDEGLLTEGEDKIRTRSRFFDTHVDDIMGRLLQSRLGPLEHNLQGIQEALAAITQRPGRGRRSMSTNERLDSDADDEDDDVGAESQHRNRSPRKDKRLEKMRSVVMEALESHQSQRTALPPPVSDDPRMPERIREIVTDVLVSHQPPPAAVQQVSADQIRAIVQDAIASTPSINTQPVEPVRPDDLRSIVMEAFATHVPQPMPPPVPEQIWPEDVRAIIAEALAPSKSLVSEAPADIPQPKIDVSEVLQAVDSIKSSIAQHASQQLQAENVRELVDDAFKRQNLEIATRAEAEAVQKRDRRIADLEARLKESTFRRDAEAAARVVAEARETDTGRLLKVTEEELALLQQAAREDEDRIRALAEERDSARRSLDAYQTTSDDVRDRLLSLDTENEHLKLKNIALESSEEQLKQQLSSITTENTALSSTLEEHRLSADKWREDIQVAYAESEKLRQAVDQAHFQAEEAVRVRETMRSKFDKLQQDMVAASQQIATERAQWQKHRDAADSRYEVLSARIEAEGRTRERLERELERLETQEREGMKLRIHLEQAQKHNARLEETIDHLRRETLEHQKNAERYERDVREARDAAHVEIRRTRVLMDADIDAANNQVNIVRHELESEISRVRAELDQVRLDADTAKERHELDLEAASDSKKQAVHDVLEKNRHHLQEQRRNFERQFDHVKQEHARALEFVREDKMRAEAFHNDKLALADSRLDHFKDKIALLEEKLQVAKEAANAAVAAASKSSTSATSSVAPSGTEKISIQALRESISVLQEQLQEREGRIELLERQLEDTDGEAPAKLKERDTEINWLRELLGVRIDDLNDLINSLARPTFDRETVRDAAIRIRTNLQMEQSEKERLISGGQQSFPTLSTLSNFASPKAVQLAAAFGNWRSKGRVEAASALTGHSTNASRNQTPSRPAPHSGPSFLSGLMTPPKSNLRRTPDLSSSSARRPPNTRSDSSSSHASTDAGFPSLKKQTQPAAPRTPPLLRKANYDQDADVEPFSESGFYDDESTMDGADMTPLALDFGRQLPR